MTTTAYPQPYRADGVRAGEGVRGLVRQVGIDTAYALLGLPLAIISFVVIIVGVALGVGTLAIVLGIFVLAGTVFAARGLADLERLRIPAVLRRARIRPVYDPAPPGAGIWRRAFTPFGQLQSWLDVLHAIVHFPVAIIAFVITVTWWAVALGGFTYWAYGWAIPYGDGPGDLAILLGFGDTYSEMVVFHLALGVFFLGTLPWVVRGSALFSAGVSRAMLTGVAEVRDRISTLTARNAAAASAEATALRRLERDIHDGPQQRLVRIAMDVGRAQQQLRRDPDRAGRTLEEVLNQTRETLDELRALSRGIAPPVLADRGLPSALAAVAGRCTVPVRLEVDARLGSPGARPDPAVENAAYFVVAEALTNVAKHSRATECRVTVARVGGRLRVRIADDGVGGAHLAKGHGLAGLADRVQAVGGALTVGGATDGGTSVHAELPC